MSIEQNIENLEIRNANVVTFVGTSSTMVDTISGRIQCKGFQHNSNVITDISGPHGRGAAVLKKYPEIAFVEGKFDANDSTNTYVQAGYTVTASSQLNSDYSSYEAFDGKTGNDVDNLSSYWVSGTLYLANTGIYNGGVQTSETSNTWSGEWIQLTLPNKIRLTNAQMVREYYAAGDIYGPVRSPASGAILGSNDGSTWSYVHSWSGLTSADFPGKGGFGNFGTISSTGYYNQYRLITTSVTGGGVHSVHVSIAELEFYGYEEDPPAGDHSVDTTFKSRFNNPHTAGVQVFVDGKGSGSNQISGGPTVTDVATTYNEPGKYWELTGELTSNISVEANTFLEGDQPHAVSVWFNSSNLEANVSNTCVFSVSDQEKLDSVNLDLQSNTWHNLTYAYQGEGGSRVTYLDGRKVAEDQAEDTFGEYPPFAMTGYSQGGYVVSASGEYPGTAYLAHEAFNGTFADNADCWLSTDATYDGTTGNYNGNANLGSGVDDGEWLKLEMPYKLVLDYISICGSTATGVNPKDWKIYGSNDDKNWDVLLSKTNSVTAAYNATSGKEHVVGATKAYKYFALVVIKSGGLTSGTHYIQVGELEYYGHRENDLVRLPDPTNVLKYPHISIPSSYTKRGYVVSASKDQYVYGANNIESRGAWAAFGNTGSEPGWQLYYDGPSNAPYDSSADGSGFYQNNALASTLTGTSHRGEWIKLELPHKLMVQKMKTDHGTQPERLGQVILLGSNNDSDWYTIKDTFALTTASAQTTDINATVAYKYIVLIVKSLQNASLNVDLKNLEYYGTGVDSVPIQIGGGNIDKVANFRVYDKFIDENQALEIWDAQKDEFGRAKSSMTLQKGRLGIGTTEPEGRLAVLDEPSGLEEFPPRAMTAEETYMEGHGVFKASSEWNRNSDYEPFAAFNKYTNDINAIVSQDRMWWSSISTFTGNPGVFNGDTSKNIGGYTGVGLKLELPYSILCSRIDLYPRNPYGDPPYSQNPRAFKFIASKDNEFWDLLHEETNFVDVGGTAHPFYINTTQYYKYFAIVVTGVAGNTTLVSIVDLQFFGTREQGQSVLHDGQLTLTKNLNVPRIGPALDADDTPRRDRLVVEYNTSTNPTFEGAVRDTSGRGNDGVFVGTATYDATEKAFTFPGTAGNYITRSQIGNSAGAWVHSFSTWVNTNDTTYNHIFSIGVDSDNDTSTLRYDAGQGGNAFKWFFYGNDANFTYSGNLLNTWLHIVGVYDGGAVAGSRRLWVNGVESVQSSSSGVEALTLPANTQLTLGERSNRAGSQALNGEISNFKLYDCALTAEEVKTLYDMGRCDEGHHVVNFSKTRVGIGLGDGEAPRAALDVREQGIFRDILFDQRSTDNNNGVSVVRYRKGGEGGNYWKNWVNVSNHYYFNYNGTDSGYFASSGPNSRVQNFTGQHRTFIKDVPFSQAGDLEGLIVSSDQNKYIKMSGGIEAGSNAITTNESLPVVSLSTTTNDKKCFGVISASEDPETREDTHGILTSIFEKERGDTRVYINSVGEGAIWVVNTNGSLEAGDYITTSNVAGYGQKQEGAGLMNYTVAKITMDCDFNPATQPIQQILRSNVVETYYLGNVHHTKTVPHEFVTTVVGADDEWSNVSISPSNTTYAEWSNLEANTQNTYTLTYTQTSNVVYDTKYTLTTTANVTESDPWDRVSIDPPSVTYAEYSNLEANTQNTYSLTFTQTTTDTKTPEEWSALESNTQSLYNMVYYQSVEEEVAATWPGAVAHTRVTDVIENELDAHGQIQWEDHATETEKAYKIRYLDVSGTQTDEANAVHIAAFVGCTYHCG